MKFKSRTGITWTQLELTGLLEDEDSHVHFERVKKHLALHSFHLTSLHAALNEILSSKLNFYDAELKGFPLSYKNPKLLTPIGEVLYDTCFIHVDIEADFYIFRPEVGQELKGVVNKKGFGHIGVLVHKTFNVSIPKPDDAVDWPGDNVSMNQEIRFTLTHLDLTSRLPFIRGALEENSFLQGCKIVMDTALFNSKSILQSNDETQENNATERISWINGNPDEQSDSETEDVNRNTREEITEKTSKKKDRGKHSTSMVNKETIEKVEKSKKRSKHKHHYDSVEDKPEESVSNDDININHDIKHEFTVKKVKSKKHSKNKHLNGVETYENSEDDSVLIKREYSPSLSSVQDSKTNIIRDEGDETEITNETEFVIKVTNKHKKSKAKNKTVEENSHIKEENSHIYEENNESYTSINDDSKKRKKKKKHSHPEENLPVKQEDISVEETCSPKIPKEKKKRKHAQIEIKTEEENNSSLIESEVDVNAIVKKEKKKRKRLLSDDEIEIKEEKGTSTETEDDHIVTKRKKKRKREFSEEDIQIKEETSDSCVIKKEDDDNRTKTKQRKKKKHTVSDDLLSTELDDTIKKIKKEEPDTAETQNEINNTTFNSPKKKIRRVRTLSDSEAEFEVAKKKSEESAVNLKSESEIELLT